jgi:uncharacterized membrane protein
MTTPTGPTNPDHPEEPESTSSGIPAEPAEPTRPVPPPEDESADFPPPPGPEEESRAAAPPPPPPPTEPAGAFPPPEPPDESPAAVPPAAAQEPTRAVPPSDEGAGAVPPPPPGAYPPPTGEPSSPYPPPPPPPPSQPWGGGYPTAPPASYEGALATPFTTGEAIGYGWRGFTQNVGPLLLLAFVVIAIQVILGIIGARLQTTVGIVLFNIVSAIVGYILTVGIIRAALAVVDGRRPEVGMLFRGQGVIDYILASIIVALAVTVGLVLCVIPGVIVMFLFQFYGYATVDESHRVGALESLSVSTRLARDNVGPVLLFDLAAIGVLILGALVCGVGLLVAYPVVIIAGAFVWRRLVRGHIAALTP